MAPAGPRGFVGGRNLFMRFFLAVCSQALLLASLAHATVRTAPAPIQPITLHPLLVGSLAEAANPLTAQFGSGLALAAAAPVPSQVLAPLAEAGPAGRVVAGALALALVDDGPAAALASARPELSGLLASARRAAGSDDALPALAQSARRDPAVTALFDGGRSASLELEGLSFGWSRLRDGKRKAARLGAGGFGIVDEHPRVPGAVVKTVEVAFDNILLGDPGELRKMVAAEEPTARALAAAGAGPRFFGKGTVGQRSVSVRERVYGESLDRLISARRFTEAEEKLVRELLGRMAAAGLKVDDMHPRNIMIGTTLSDPARRAYVIDGGQLLEVDPSISAGALRAELERQDILVKSRWLPQAGITIDTRRPFQELLAEGLARSKRTAFWQRFVDGLKEGFADMPIGFK